MEFTEEEISTTLIGLNCYLIELLDKELASLKNKDKETAKLYEKLANDVKYLIDKFKTK